MNAADTDALVSAVAQTMVHFLWQAIVVAIALELILRVVAPRRAQTRYATYCAMLLLLMFCPVVTFVRISGGADDVAPGGYWRGASVAEREAAVLVFSPAVSGGVVDASLLPTTDDVQAWVERHRFAIAAVWLCGVVGLSMRLVVGNIWLWVIARRGQPLPQSWSQRVDRLARRLRFSTPPTVRVVERISQAMAVGVVRPMVLLPASWVSMLDSEVLEAVIAHELAHLRRWDLPINLLQRVAESLLFFHPVVWWCSRRIRIEREMCCDEAAVAALGSTVHYVNALSHIAEQTGLAYEPVCGTGIGGSKMVLLERIRSLLGQASDRRGRFYGMSCAALGALAASVAWALVMAASASNDDSPRSVAESPLGQNATNEFPIPRRVEPQTERFMIGQGVNSDAGLLGKIADAPTEHAKKILPNYTIEPPDILTIDALRLRPKSPYHLQSGDELQIMAEPAEANLSARGFFIDPEGRIDLGPRYGKVHIAGLTIDEATVAVRETVGAIHRDPEVSLTVIESPPMQPITGEHLVAPDGTVNLGTYGLVSVAGMTLGEAKQAIDEHLSQYLDDPHVSVSVFAYNSKVYYVITQGAGQGDAVSRLPITGNETVLDAIAQVNGLSPLSHKEIWIARPKPGGEPHDEILPVNWQAIAPGAATASNYQLLPGDRVFVVERTVGNVRNGRQ